jgi:TPR repeat protein
MRSLRIFLCSVSLGAWVVAAYASSTENEWSALPPKVVECFQIAAEGSGSTLEALATGGLRPSDARLAEYMKICVQYSDGLRNNFSCRLQDAAGHPVDTMCREYWAINRGGNLHEVDPISALRMAFIEKADVQIVYTENPEGQQTRESRAAQQSMADDPEGDLKTRNDAESNRLSSDAEEAPAERMSAESPSTTEPAAIQKTTDISETSSGEGAPISQTSSGDTLASMACIRRKLIVDGLSAADGLLLHDAVKKTVESRDSSAALDSFKALEGKGSTQASYFLAYDSDNISQIEIQRYRRAAEQEHPAARRALGLASIFGIGSAFGLAQNFDSGLRLLEDAWQCGDADAAFSLGEIYETGKYTAKDLNEALRWYKRAAVLSNDLKHGDFFSKNGMEKVKVLSSQLNVEIDIKPADKIAEQMKAKGVQAREQGRIRDAIAFFKDAYTAGDDDSAVEIGELYLKGGDGVPVSYEMAYHWFLQGTFGRVFSTHAYLALGELVEKGHGVASDMKTAIEWYRRAADGGQEAARERLASLGVSSGIKAQMQFLCADQYGAQQKVVGESLMQMLSTNVDSFNQAMGFAPYKDLCVVETSKIVDPFSYGPVDTIRTDRGTFYFITINQTTVVGAQAL